jgi:hypothetical protein
MHASPPRPSTPLGAARAALLILASALLIVSTARANPTTVTIPGSLQSEIGCPGDWDPACATTHLTYDAGDDVWQGTWSVLAGSYEYKVALNDTWDVNYGLNAVQNGANIPLNLAGTTSVKFYYDDKTHWITDNVNSVIATAVGSFQSEMGCASDWDPGCLRSWLQDPDGNGIYSFTTNSIPVGSYEAKVAINEAWDENYGAGGLLGGANIPFSVASSGAWVTFSYDGSTHVLSISVLGSPPPGASSVTVAGSLQSEVGCAGDWDPACAMTHLTFDAGDGVWQGTWPVPAGSFEYKAALDDNWTLNYGLNATQNGANISLNLLGPASVKFYYDGTSHWITDNVNSVIATVAGSFQSEMGCAGDWDPGCLRSWLQDPDGNGIYSFTTSALPPGSYEAKVAINESWDENYGEGGTPGGANIPFTVTTPGTPTLFSYDPVSHILTIFPTNPVPTTKSSWGRLKTLYR